MPRCASLVLVFFVATTSVLMPHAASLADKTEEAWKDLKSDLYGQRQILDGSSMLMLEAPYRAHDAALVPISIGMIAEQDAANVIKTVTLVIDENPAPVAAIFKLAPESSIGYISTRVRVNSYGFVRAIAELSDGRLYMVQRYVKASGGCSAPASKNYEQAVARIGQMRLRQFARQTVDGLSEGTGREVQLQIRHPNHSGLQMDQVTGYYIPAHFVQTIDIRQGSKSLLSVEGAISLSEDPSIRFRFSPINKGRISVKVEDTEAQVFERSFELKENGTKGT